jgi:hypothetical protein
MTSTFDSGTQIPSDDMAIPCDLDRECLPVGLQLGGIPGHETALFETASLVERVLDFHRSNTPPRRFQADDVSEKAIR